VGFRVKITRIHLCLLAGSQSRRGGTKPGPWLIEGGGIVESVQELKKRLNEIDEKIADTEKRLPAHSVKPPIMTELFALEDERETILAKLKALESE